MGTSIRYAPVLAFLLFLPQARDAFAPDQDEPGSGFPEAVSELVTTELVPRIEEAVHELRRRRRFREAYTLLECLRAFDAENSLVRRLLRGRYRTAPLDDEKDIEILVACVDSYLASVHELMRTHEVRPRSLDGVGALEIVLEVHPDHAGVRTELGYELHGGEWVLAETLQAMRMRGLVTGGRKHAVAPLGFAPIEDELDQSDRRLQGPEGDLRWSTVFKLGSLRVLGTDLNPEDVRQACLDAARAEAAFEHWVGKTNGLRIRILMIDRDELGALARRHTGITEDMAQYIGAASSISVGQTFDLVLWERDPVLRRDLVTQHVFLMNCRNPLGADGTPWVRTGSGAWFTQRVNGSSTVLHQGLESGWPRSDSDWLAAALSLSEEGTLPPIVDVTGGSLFTSEHAVAAYALTAYLAEGTTSLRSVLKWSPDPEFVFERDLGLRSIDLDVRMHQWLGEFTAALERADQTRTRSSKGGGR